MNLAGRRKGGSSYVSYYDDDRSSKTTKSGVAFTSEMQGIVEQKRYNESKAADLVADYLSSLAERTYDEDTLKRNLENMLNGFTTEEQLRIVSYALVRALCRVS